MEVETHDSVSYWMMINGMIEEDDILNEFHRCLMARSNYRIACVCYMSSARRLVDGRHAIAD